MARRGGKLWTALGRQAARTARKMQHAMTQSMLRSAVEQGTAMGKAARRVLSGVDTPVHVPVSFGGGSWEEGVWGVGPLAQRRYRVFVPSGVSAARPAPLLVLLHGCGQDAASFAACARVAAVARSARCVVLLPEQSPQANAQRCWNWFRPGTRGAAEATLLMAMIDHVCQRYAVERERVCALGLSAGGAMAMMLGLRFPERFLAVGSHSGAVPYSAGNAAQAARAMQGQRVPDLHALRLMLAGRRPPPLLLLHGDADSVVAFENATAAAALWLDLLPPGSPPPAPLPPRQVRRGARKPVDVFDWQAGARPYVRLVRVEGLGHAWSGGAPGQAFADPGGPDALKIALRFFSVNGGGGN